MLGGRTFEKAEQLANSLGGRAAPFEALRSELARADIVISGTGAPGIVIRREDVEAAQATRRGRPLFVIDIADSTDYRFGGAVNGVALHTGANDYDFPYTVEPGATVSIVINMQAPSTPGSYGETWMITTGATTSCQFDFVVSVQ